MQYTEHPGRHVADITLYTLSTCPYCRATKEFLNQNDIEYKYVDIDQQAIPDAIEIENIVLKYNPNDSYPTIVINDGEQVIIGFQKNKLQHLIEESTEPPVASHRGNSSYRKNKLPFTEHPGRHVADIELFTLSTCPFCKATKEYLNENGIEYKYVDIDQQSLPEAEKIEATILKYNPEDTYPTIVVNDGEEVIVGFQKDKLAQLIGAA